MCACSDQCQNTRCFLSAKEHRTFCVQVILYCTVCKTKMDHYYCSNTQLARGECWTPWFARRNTFSDFSDLDHFKNAFKNAFKSPYYVFWACAVLYHSTRVFAVHSKTLWIGKHSLVNNCANINMKSSFVSQCCTTLNVSTKFVI